MFFSLSPASLPCLAEIFFGKKNRSAPEGLNEKKKINYVFGFILLLILFEWSAMVFLFLFLFFF